MANLSPDSENLVNFDSVWLQVFCFGDFRKHLDPNFLVWRNILTHHFLQGILSKRAPVSFLCTICRLYLHASAYIFICRVTTELADGLKIRDIK